MKTSRKRQQAIQEREDRNPSCGTFAHGNTPNPIIFPSHMLKCSYQFTGDPAPSACDRALPILFNCDHPSRCSCSSRSIFCLSESLSRHDERQKIQDT